MNTITEAARNSMHGSLFWFFRNRTLNATDPTFEGINPPDWRHQAGATIGGPIKKNKLFYFFSGELQRHKRRFFLRTLLRRCLTRTEIRCPPQPIH